MVGIRLSSHDVLQDTADALSARFSVSDPYVLRFAVLEVLQNAVQHGFGSVRIDCLGDRLVVRNRVAETSQPTAHIGLAMLEGVRVVQRGDEFTAVVMVHEVRLASLEIEGLEAIA